MHLADSPVIRNDMQETSIIYELIVRVRRVRGNLLSSCNYARILVIVGNDVAVFTTSDSVLSLNGDFSIVGRMLVIDEQPDNYGAFGQTNDVFDYSDQSQTTQPNPKIACGVIGMERQENAVDLVDSDATGPVHDDYTRYVAVLNKGSQRKPYHISLTVGFMIIFMAITLNIP